MFATAGMAVAACGGGAPAAEAPAAAQAPAEAPAAPAVVAGPSSQYNEAPMLADMVAAGQLPVVDERLPVNPLVLDGLDGIGNYGGLWRSGFSGQADTTGLGQLIWRGLVSINQDLVINPMVAESWEVSEDASQYTFHLRKGMRWSDGEVFDSSDFVYWFEEEVKNETLTSVFPAYLTSPVDGENIPVEMSAPDATTVVFKFASPNALFHMEGKIILNLPV